MNELKASGRGIVVDKSNAKETYPLRWTSGLENLSIYKNTKDSKQVTKQQEQTNKEISSCLSE